MPLGTVKWFDVRKGFGFILDEAGQDVFVHYTVIHGDGFRRLNDGEPVEFEVEQGPKGLLATKVTRLRPEAGPPPQEVQEAAPQEAAPAAPVEAAIEAPVETGAATQDPPQAGDPSTDITEGGTEEMEYEDDVEVGGPGNTLTPQGSQEPGGQQQGFGRGKRRRHRGRKNKGRHGGGAGGGGGGGGGGQGNQQQGQQGGQFHQGGQFGNQRSQNQGGGQRQFGNQRSGGGGGGGGGGQRRRQQRKTGQPPQGGNVRQNLDENQPHLPGQPPADVKGAMERYLDRIKRSWGLDKQ